jgi:hypothetical protein
VRHRTVQAIADLKARTNTTVRKRPFFRSSEVGSDKDNAYGALPPGPLLSSGGGHIWQISATTRDTAMTPVNASMLIGTKRVILLMVPKCPSTQ